MKTHDLLTISLAALRTHRLRTALTMLGVVFGVAAVVAMLSIGEGAKREALDQISILGVNNVIVRARPPATQGSGEESFARSPGLSLADGENLTRFGELVTNVVAQRFESAATVRCGSREVAARVVATFPAFVSSSSIGVERGRFLADSDGRDFDQVCVLGAKARRGLFDFEDPIGRTVRIGDLDFQVVGVMADKYIGRGKVEGFELKNLNEDVYIPFETAVKKLDRAEPGGKGFVWDSKGRAVPAAGLRSYNLPEADQLTVTVRDVRLVPAAAALIERVLQRRHSGVPDYEIVVPESLLRQSQKTQRIFNLVMGTIAGLSLLVGGIGIMNIMLASVLERTREIGVRRAVGATPRDIRRQFLLEAVAICLVGCAAGLILGLVISRGISLVAGWPTVVSVVSIVLAVGISTAVGLIFGVYPANRAAGVDVIDALHYE